jgi:hypothetical protein
MDRERLYKLKGLANVLENNAKHFGIRMSRENGLAMTEAAQGMRELLVECERLEAELESALDDGGSAGDVHDMRRSRMDNL